MRELFRIFMRGYRRGWAEARERRLMAQGYRETAEEEARIAEELLPAAFSTLPPYDERPWTIPVCVACGRPYIEIVDDEEQVCACFDRDGGRTVRAVEVMPKPQVCETCKGRGYIPRSRYESHGPGLGSGTHWTESCPDCAGNLTTFTALTNPSTGTDPS